MKVIGAEQLTGSRIDTTNREILIRGNLMPLITDQIV